MCRPAANGMGSTGAVHTLGLPTPLINTGVGSLSGFSSFTNGVSNGFVSGIGSGMGSLGGLNSLGSVGPATSSSLTSSRGRQRNSVAVVDSRDHIYEELDISRGPPKLTPISGVLPQVSLIFLLYLVLSLH